jgi:hypothetical protein
MAFAGVGCELCFGFSLWFAPGWANGWPFGLTIHVVWSVGMALLLFLVLVTTAAGLGAAVGWVGSQHVVGLRHGRKVYVAWLFLAAAAALALALETYQRTHATTLRMWPNGYPNKRA